MKTNFKVEDFARHKRSVAGSTLVEIMFTSAIMVMVLAALITANLMGMHEDTLVESKAGASDSSRKTLNKLPMDIRAAKRWSIGNMSGTNFTAIAAGTSQTGPGLKLFMTTSISSNILYYFDLTYANNSNVRLIRIDSGGSSMIIASNLINTNFFIAEDYQGNIATDTTDYKNVIHTTLQFCQFEYPLTQVGTTNALYDYYQLTFRATPHLPE